MYKPSINENAYYQFTYKTNKGRNYNVKIYTDKDVSNAEELMETILTLNPFVDSISSKVSLQHVVPRVISFTL